METVFITDDNRGAFYEIIWEYQFDIWRVYNDLEEDLDTLKPTFNIWYFRQHLRFAQLLKEVKSFYLGIASSFYCDRDVGYFISKEVKKGEIYKILNKKICHDVTANIISYL